MSASRMPPSSSKVSRGRPSSALVDQRVRVALRLLDDPIALEASPLVRLDSVQSLVAGSLRGRTCADGLALRLVIRTALADVAKDLSGTPVGTLAQALHDGRTQSAAAKEIGISEEHLCRRWKPALVSLIRERLEYGDRDRLAA